MARIIGENRTTLKRDALVLELPESLGQFLMDQTKLRGIKMPGKRVLANIMLSLKRGGVLPRTEEERCPCCRYVLRRRPAAPPEILKIVNDWLRAHDGAAA